MKTVSERFWVKVNKGEGCWEWSAGCLSNGYGSFRIGNSTLLAHRVAWELANQSPVPTGLHVLHRCDNPRCCRPDHFFLGTHLDNMKDKVSKNRQARGESCGTSKLTQEQVSEIRRLYIPGVVTMQQLADRYGVTKAAISLIVRQKQWKPLDNRPFAG